MIIKTSISFKEYAKLLFSLTYKKPMIRVIVGVGVAMATWIIGYSSGLTFLPKPTYYQYLTLIIISIVQPLAIYSTIWKNYHSSSHLKEALEIEFTQKEIKINGDSFYTELTWAKMYKVVELRHWFLIYQNNLSAVTIPKKSFHSIAEIQEFKKMLRSIPNVPLHLKSYLATVTAAA
jgi:YcxB-like protein